LITGTSVMQDECVDLSSRNFPMLRLSLAYASQGMRPKLLALYALLSTVEECLYCASDPVVSKAKLYWWREELEQARHGRGSHPLSLSLQSSGVLAVWPDALTERLFGLALQRTEAETLNDESILQQFCETLGWLHLEMEVALQNAGVPDQKVIRQLAASNGLMQLFRESFKASQATYYWVPLSDCARLGIERLQVAADPFQTEVREVFHDITQRILEENILRNLASLSRLPSSWAVSCRHWLLLSLLQQRHLLLLQSDLVSPIFTGNSRKLLQQVRLGDGWFAWRAARHLNAAGKAGQASKK